MQRSVIIINVEKVQGWLKLLFSVFFLPAFIIKENATFYLDISENKDVKFSLQIHRSPELYLWTLWAVHWPEVQNPCTKCSLK